jgi:hypothetical protein
MKADGEFASFDPAASMIGTSFVLQLAGSFRSVQSSLFIKLRRASIG